jgi:hypothetical protein
VAFVRKLFTPLTASLLTLLLAGQLAAQSPAVATLVKADRLLDPRTGNVLSPAAVLIENGKIKEVGSPSRVQTDAPAGTDPIRNEPDAAFMWQRRRATVIDVVHDTDSCQNESTHQHGEMRE